MARRPHTLRDLTITYSGGMANLSDRNVWARGDGDVPVGAAWHTDDVVGGGRLVVSMDVNWMSSGYRGSNWTQVAENLAYFMTGAAAPPTPTATRTLSRQRRAATLQAPGEADPTPSTVGP